MNCAAAFYFSEKNTFAMCSERVLLGQTGYGCNTFVLVSVTRWFLLARVHKFYTKHPHLFATQDINSDLCKNITALQVDVKCMECLC